MALITELIAEPIGISDPLGINEWVDIVES